MYFLNPFQVAASVAFLIARYFARERILKLVEGNKKFLAIDKAIGENGFKVVTLLRLSPLLPFSLGNYLYGLTSVKFVPYVLGRFASSLFILTFLSFRFLCWKTFVRVVIDLTTSVLPFFIIATSTILICSCSSLQTNFTLLPGSCELLFQLFSLM